MQPAMLLLDVAGRVILVSLALLVTGCLAPDEVDHDGRSAPSLEPDVERGEFHIKGSWPAGNGDPYGFTSRIHSDAMSVLVEAAWSCPAGPCRISVVLFQSGHEPQSWAELSSPARIELAEPAPGSYTIQAHPGNATIQADGEFRVTQFLDPEVPSDYSAFGETTA